MSELDRFQIMFGVRGREGTYSFNDYPFSRFGGFVESAVELNQDEPKSTVTDTQMSVLGVLMTSAPMLMMGLASDLPYETLSTVDPDAPQELRMWIRHDHYGDIVDVSVHAFLASQGGRYGVVPVQFETPAEGGTVEQHHPCIKNHPDLSVAFVEVPDSVAVPVARSLEYLMDGVIRAVLKNSDSYGGGA